jgi:hypothetical protein
MLGVSRSAVTVATKNGRLTRGDDGLYDGVESLTRWAQGTTPQAGVASTTTGERAARGVDYQHERALREQATAELKRLEADTAAGSLVPVADVEAEWGARVRQLRDSLRAVGSRTAAALALATSALECRRIVEAAVDEALAAVADG